ncbi:hypothetical protein [Janibacter alittae]|uniref:DUF1795 domain-containing protein n=1 Tax=Janibacter alittae TaxID=3115209 RepID=A0ABZ2MHD0_9MICO
MSGRRSCIVAVTTAFLVTVAACSSSDEPEEENVKPSQSQMQPTGTPTPPVTPAAISSQWRTVEGPDFTIGVPGVFEEEIVTADNGTKAYVFDAPRTKDDDNSLERVAILRDEKPKQDVIQQSFVLEEMQSVDNEAGVERSEVTWPGAEKAVLVQWTNPVGGADGKRRETWQLMAQISPDLILNVVALGDADTFDDSELPTILATFKGA